MRRFLRRCEGLRFISMCLDIEGLDPVIFGVRTFQLLVFHDFVHIITCSYRRRHWMRIQHSDIFVSSSDQMESSRTTPGSCTDDQNGGCVV